MKLEIPIIVGFDDMESLLDDLKKLQTYKLAEGDEMVLVDIEDVAKVLMDHVKAKKSVKGDDPIGRQQAIDEIKAIYEYHDTVTEDRIIDHFKRLPSAEPDIIRCKDCKFWETAWAYGSNANLHYCPLVDGVRREDFYCADAEERRTDERLDLQT